VPQIEVTFDIDANGIVNVSAKDTGTGKEQRVTVSGTTQLSKEEVERMVREAQEKAQDDERARELAEAKNRAESLVYNAEKSLKDLGDKVSPEDKESTERGIADVRQALGNDDKAALDQAISTLEQSVHKLAEELYKNAGTPPGGDGESSPPPPPGGDDDVIDADFRPTE
jgi:molecular chaperone DnaK